MKQITSILLAALLVLAAAACDDDNGDDVTVAEALQGVWLANATIGDLGAESGSLAGAGWTSYQLTLGDNNTFTVTGDNPYGIPAYGSTATVEGIITYSGTYTIDDAKNPMWIDLTCTVSDQPNFFSIADSLQPLQNGIFELSDDDKELTIQYGAILAFIVPRPTAFMVDSTGVYDSGTLVKQ